MSNKTLYWLLESNWDLSLTLNSLEECQLQIEADFHSLDDNEKEEIEYTITPQYLTQEEYDALPEY